MRTISIDNIRVGEGCPLALIAGPCVIETEKIALQTAEKVKEITSKLAVPFIYKSSYDKSNRSSIKYYRGPGIKEGMRILARIKKDFSIPVLSDVHCRNDIPQVKDILDVIQIPAYLCQQTDLVVEVAKTGKVVNVKKGQFMAPWDMKKICEKITSVGNDNIILTERGTIFGYNNLVADMRSIPIMQEMGYPVAVDVTHIIRIPGPTSFDSSGGQPKFIPVLSRAAVAAGCDILFLEVHPNPEEALCDAASMLRLSLLEDILTEVYEISKIVRRGKKL